MRLPRVKLGKITTNEGKPLYKIVGEFQNNREHIHLNNLEKEVKKLSKFKFTNLKVKAVIHHLNWVNDPQFKVMDPPEGTVNPEFNNFLWVETMDNISNSTKVFFLRKRWSKLLP